MLKHNDRVTYNVLPNESITIEITRIASQGTVVVVLDKSRLANEGTDEEQRYAFEVTKELGKVHLVQIEAAFPPGDGARARFDVKVSEVTGAEPKTFDVGSIAISDRIKRKGLKFRIRQVAA